MCATLFNFHFSLGLREVSKISEALSVKRTHLLNYITRNGAPMGNTFGVIALIYSAIGVGLSFIQDENDEINTAVAATTTGTLYGALSQSKAMEGLQGELVLKVCTRNLPLVLQVQH